MYLIDKYSNRIAPITQQKFSELGFKERDHLQEWLAHQPDALGEELLIIQKEFDGFDDTKERLDLLALDKNGNLVIIENKLDDSGRDVVWQALKYASYCASLTKAQIVDIFHAYLDRYEATCSDENKPDAASVICDFLEIPEMDEVKLNTGNSQRILFVAANFRKEVTSTALWLIGQGIDIKCIKVTPFSLGEQLLLNVEQIIPTPEAQELMIGINAKEAEEKSTDVTVKTRHNIRRNYWERLLEVFHDSNCSLYDNISASKDHWLSAGSGVSGCTFGLIFSKTEIRVELNIARSITEENKFLYDQIYSQKDQLETVFGNPLEWQRLDDKKSSRIQYSMPADGFTREKWDQWIQWHLENMTKFDAILRKPLGEAAQKMKTDL